MKNKLYYKSFPGHMSSFKVDSVDVGSGFLVIAGSCAVESIPQFGEIAEEISNSAHILRGGLFKARTSPYSFHGYGKSGLSDVVSTAKALARPLVIEALNQEQALYLAEHVDLIQIGARNMYNYPLLTTVAETGRAVLLKRHFAATLDELLLAAEYILAHGNHRVILCERGIRTFETRTRNCLDLSGVAVLKQITHLPVLVDPSHAAGDSSLIAKLCYAAAAVGADGLMLEVHKTPEAALSDGPQSITPLQLKEIVAGIERIRKVIPGRDSGVSVEF